MKIIHVIDYFQPKLGYQETYLAKAQARDGHSVYVVTSERYAPILYPAVRNTLGPRIKTSGFFIEESINVIRLPIHVEVNGRVWLRGLMRTLVNLKPDIVILHGILSISVFHMLRLKRKLPDIRVIIDDHMVYSASRPAMKVLYRLFRHLLSRKITQTVDSLVATHEETLEFMTQVYGIPKSRIDFIPLGCDSTLFQRNENERKSFRSKYGIPKDAVLFVYAGKLLPIKGPHILVEAAISIMDEHTDACVALVGNGRHDYVEKLRRRINASGFKNRFLLIDLVPHGELYKVYSAADVGVWPLQCSLTMIEAMSCHLPIIISDESGVLNRVSHNNGFLYQNAVAKDLAEKMKLLIDEGRRRKMGQNARKFAESVDWSDISKRFLALI